MRWLPSRLLVSGFFSSILAACGAQPPSSSELAFSNFHPHRSERNLNLTPGDLCSRQNPHFDGLRYSERIPHCRREVSHEQKQAVAAAYGIYGDERHAYEIDHLIPLNIGGSNHTRNLWPLYRPYAREKSQYEQWLMQQVVDGRVTQVIAIRYIQAWRPGTKLGGRE